MKVISKASLIIVILIFSFGVSVLASGVGVVNIDVLNVREGAGIDFSVKGQLVKGQIVEIIEHVNDEWAKVSFNNKIGFVAVKHLAIKAPDKERRSAAALKGKPINEKGYVSTEISLKLRSQPSYAAELIAYMPKHAPVKLLEDMGHNWAKVEYDGRVGYASLEYLGRGEPPVEEEEEEEKVQDTQKEKRAQESKTSRGQAVNRQPAATPAPAPAVTYGSGSSAKGSEIVALAKQYAGKPYVRGGNGPNSFDCSGYAKYVYGKFGINLSRTTYTQVGEGRSVSKGELAAGDLVFFKQGGSSVDHVGIYIGGGQFIHATKPGDVVKVDNLNSGYYNKYYYTARRILN